MGDRIWQSSPALVAGSPQQDTVLSGDYDSAVRICGRRRHRHRYPADGFVLSELRERETVARAWIQEVENARLAGADLLSEHEAAASTSQDFLADGDFDRER